MSDMGYDPLSQLSNYQAYLANQRGEDDPFQLSQDALMQLVIGSLGKKKGSSALGSQLTTLGKINTLLGKPEKEKLDPQWVETPSVTRSMYGNDTVYSNVFDQLDKGTPLHDVVKDISDNAAKLGDYDPDTVSKAAADYAKERAENVNKKAQYNAQHPRQTPSMPSQDDLVEQFVKQYAPTATADKLAARATERAPKIDAVRNQLLDTIQKGQAQNLSRADIQSKFAAATGGNRVDPNSAEAQDAHRRRIIEQIVSRKLAERKLASA